MFSTETRNTVGSFVTEELEPRLLMSSTINISAGYQDATSAIQAALNSAGNGGTVVLGAGAYNVSSMLTIPSGTTLQGNGNATLNWTGSGMGYLLYSPWDSNGTKVNGVTLNGAGYKADPDGNNISITNNTFENVSFQDAYYGNGIYIPDQETGTNISGNSFNNISGNLGIYIFNAISSTISNNSFTNDGEAIKGQWFNAGANCVISNNTMNGMTRIGIECQGNPTNLTVTGNWVGNWRQAASNMGLSIATGEGNGINITNNTILGSGISNPSTNYTAIEAMGNNLTISGNYGVGWGWGQLVGFTNHWVTENNTWGVNTADYAIEAGGVNPSVNTGNVNVAINAFSGHASSTPAVTSAPTTTTTTTSPTTTTTTSSSSSTTSSTSSSTTSKSSSLPSGWSDSDIGSVASAGSASYSNGTYTVSGAGTQVWGSSDSFNYAYQTVGSSSTITAEVSSTQSPNQYSKAGIMVRSSLSNSASNVYLYLQSNGQIMLTDRSSNGASTSWPASISGKAPMWLRLVVNGNTVQAYYSTNGSSFTLLGTVSVSLPSSAYAGLAVSSNISSLDTATFSNVSVS